VPVCIIKEKQNKVTNSWANPIRNAMHIDTYHADTKHWLPTTKHDSFPPDKLYPPEIPKR
jgi:hypothetical protein